MNCTSKDDLSFVVRPGVVLDAPALGRHCPGDSWRSARKPAEATCRQWTSIVCVCVGDFSPRTLQNSNMHGKGSCRRVHNEEARPLDLCEVSKTQARAWLRPTRQEDHAERSVGKLLDMELRAQRENNDVQMHDYVMRRRQVEDFHPAHTAQRLVDRECGARFLASLPCSST